MTQNVKPQKNQKDKVNGWVILNKPSGITSTKAVSIVRRAFNAAKAGHAGTLDPLASGILPIAMGEATKTIPYVMDSSKDYAFTVQWGCETTTDDGEGEVTTTHDHRPSLDEIQAILPQFRGRIAQVPPIYSAIKKDGVRAYALARQNQPVDLEARNVEISHLDCVDCSGETASFEATTGKGVYIRSLGRDMARALGSAGHIIALERRRVGAFLKAESIPLDFFNKINNSAEAFEALHPILTALDDIPVLAISEQDALRLRCGQKIVPKQRVSSNLADSDGDDVVMTALYQGELIALVRLCGDTASPIRVFNLSSS